MEIHNYNSETGEYLSTRTARQNPRPTSPHDEFLLPANATFKTPNITGGNEANVFNVELDEWEIKPDYRGLTYYLIEDNSEVTFDLGEEPDFNIHSETKIPPTAEEIAAEELLNKKFIRDEALANLIHDFGDGRVMQVRNKDESNIRNAIDIMTKLNMPSIDWFMLDDKKYPVTIAELEAALFSGQTQALAIWSNFNP